MLALVQSSSLAGSDLAQHSAEQLAVLAGSAINQDGRSSSLTAPNGPSQQDVMRAALVAASLQAWEVGHLQMHGTGTSLGDPIEVGAAAAVLLRKEMHRMSPLQLKAAKSMMGHAEPAAGIVGVTQLALLLGRQGVDPLLHLTSINPYVASALGSAAQHGAAHRAAAPRQPAPATAADAGASMLLGGISSFAFQGTNAHAIVGKQLGDFALPSPGAAFLEAAAVQRTRYWVLPAAHPLISGGGLGSAGAGGRAIQFDCQLLAPRLALYADHIVFGRVLFPAAGMLEAMLASGVTALDSSSAGTLAVRGVAIAAPLVLPHPSQQQGSGAVMRCSLIPATGEVELGHAERASSKRRERIASGSFALAAATAATVAAHAVVAVALRALAVRPVLLGRVLAAAVAAGHATGTIVADRRLGTDGYLVPPPGMDACLHLGVAAPGCGAKVPVAVGAFALTDRGAAASAGVGCGELAGATSAAYGAPAGPTDTASFALRTAAGGAMASLAGLETKVSKSRAAGQAAAAASVQPADYLYEMDWAAASHPASLDASLQPQQARAAVMAFGSSAVVVDLATGPHAAASAVLAVVQQAHATQAASLAAVLPEALPDGGPASLAAAGTCALAAGALEGLLRVAATEQATAAYSLTAADVWSAAARAGDASAAQERGILATTRLHSGVAAAPRLLPR